MHCKGYVYGDEVPTSKWCSRFMPKVSSKLSKLVVLLGIDAQSFLEDAYELNENTTHG